MSPRSRASWIREGSASVLELSFELSVGNFQAGEADSGRDTRMNDEEYELLQNYPGNSLCMDCQCRETEWASVTFGILFCADCSGAHRYVVCTQCRALIRIAVAINVVQEKLTRLLVQQIIR